MNNTPITLIDKENDEYCKKIHGFATDLNKKITPAQKIGFH
jgi:hypothetical protein